jgi:hypothetical protein
MKVTKVVGEDGKTTGSVIVRIPRGPEVYEPADGLLYSEETLTEDEFDEQSEPIDPTKKVTPLADAVDERAEARAAKK